MTPAELRAKAQELAPAGCAMSAAVLELLDDLDGALALLERLGDRCLIQSGIITRMVERKYPDLA